MPKKRHTNLYSKPPSTVHPSLHSAGGASSSNNNDAPPTVNELITSLRRSHVSSVTAAPTAVTPTLPPQIRQLLSQPETPAPRPRDRRQRYDAAGRRLPPGPPPPRSWLENSRHAKPRGRDKDRLYPHDIDSLPGVRKGGSRKLQDMCLRTMARDWAFIRNYEINNLADLPTGLRVSLLSHIAVYGPEEGVGAEGLNTLLTHPTGGEHNAENNEGFFRLDLSGSVGRSISFTQLMEIIKKPPNPPPDATAFWEYSWEDAVSSSLGPPIMHLTHLSLSHPPPSISWPRLLSFAKHVPTLTHLSLAHWPVPSLTPNAKTAVMTSPHGKDIQYGGTNYYSHSLDNDYREASAILKRLATHLYNIEYLDLEGCTDWLLALRWNGFPGGIPIKGRTPEGIDWNTQWAKLRTLVVRCGYVLHENSEFWEVKRFTEDFKMIFLLPKFLASVRKGRWIELVKDDVDIYEGLWKDGSEESKKKRRQIEEIRLNRWAKDLVPAIGEGTEALTTRDIERRSVWEQ